MILDYISTPLSVLDNDNNYRKEEPTFEYRKSSDAGIDLHACIEHTMILQPNEVILIPTNIQVDMRDDPSIMALVLPRSGTGHKRGIICGNGTGVIDANYHGVIHISCWNRSDTTQTIEPMERIAQLIFVPIVHVTPNKVTVFKTSTERGSSGFGSSGT